LLGLKTTQESELQEMMIEIERLEKSAAEVEKSYQATSESLNQIKSVHEQKIIELNQKSTYATALADEN
jgi:archaellum component FlaC